MAADLVRLMRVLGHERFIAVGHDRGGYVVQRLALDHPEVVERLVILGDVPIGEALARCDARFAQAWWHWFFMGQPAPLAERLISADPQAWYHLDPRRMGGENHADALRAVGDPAVRHAMCEDYRAGLGPDRAADDADRAAGRVIRAAPCWPSSAIHPHERRTAFGRYRQGSTGMDVVAPVGGHTTLRPRGRLRGRVVLRAGQARPVVELLGVVVPEPGLTGLEALDERVPLGLRVRLRVLLGRRIAASDVAALRAAPQVHPPAARLVAFHASRAAGRDGRIDARGRHDGVAS